MAAVLTVALAGAAHALTVEIVLPSTDPLLIATDRPQAFEAVAYDDQQQDVTSEVTWSWDFDDGSEPDTDNPTEHVFETAGDYTVTVTGVWSAQQQQDDAEVGIDAEEGTGTFVLARQVGQDTYQSLAGDEMCHTRYVIAFEPEGREYDGVSFNRKYAWVPEFSPQPWFTQSQQITLDNVQREAWVAEWTSSECPGQAEAGEFNAPVNWQIIGKYLDGLPPDDVEVYELIGEKTWTINNTVVSSPTGVLFYDPDDEELDSCEISWTTTHQNVYNVKFVVPIHIYDLDGNELYTYTKTNVPLGNDSWVWDGTITPQEPEGPDKATKGVYTYRLGVVGEMGTCGGVRCVCTEPGEGCARGDWDKSAFLEISLVDPQIWDVDPAEEKVEFSVWYYLNQDATGVPLRVYDPRLACIFAYAGLPEDAGMHRSLHYDFPIDPENFGGHYSFVLDASETGETAESNRDRAVKWAQQMGKVEFIAPIVQAQCGRPGVDPGWFDWRPAVVDQRVDFYGSERGFGDMEITKREWRILGDWFQVPGQSAWAAYATTGDKTASYRVTYTDDRGCQRTVEDTCDLTVFTLTCDDMWFLDVDPPPDGYPDETAFVATGATTGQFQWAVVSGTDTVDLENDTDYVTKTDNNSVGVHATGFSATEEDVEIAFSYRRPQDEDLVPVGSRTLTVHRPRAVLMQGYPADFNYGTYGYVSIYRFWLQDLRGNNLPAPLPMNEVLVDGGSDYEGEDWPPGDERAYVAGTLGDAIGAMLETDEEWPYLQLLDNELHGLYTFSDRYGVGAGMPEPQRPSTPYGWERIDWQNQEYHAGSLTRGEGVLIKSHKVQRYLGHARQE